jgi:hypothetical protein
MSVADHSLGTGTFAEVRKAVDIETGDLRAIKVSGQIERKLTSTANRQTSICQQPQDPRIISPRNRYLPIITTRKHLPLDPVV